VSTIKEKQRKKGTVYVVRYYDADQRKYVERTFDLKKDAQAFEATVILAQRRGDLAALDAGTETLRDFEQEWWENYAELHLEAHTRRDYRRLIDKHILPELGRHQLRRLNARMLSTWAAQLDTGDATKRKVMAILQGILERAAEWERIPGNPMKVVRKPGRSRARVPRPLGRDRVESIRRSLVSDRDSTLVAVLAYGGLRPSEALALKWMDVGDRTLVVERAVALGEEKGTKNRRVRHVEISDVLRQALLSWRLSSGTRTGLVFPGRDGKPWTDTQYRNWRTRHFHRAAPGVNPYDLRHTRASELFAEGRNPAWIAEQMGHTLQTLLSTYVHVIEEQKTDRRQTGLEAAES
jgi:integrase